MSVISCRGICHIRLLVSLLSAMLVTGCGGITQRLQANLQESQAIADRCDMVQDPFQANTDRLIRRLRTMLTFKVQQAKSRCAPAMNAALDDLIARLDGRIQTGSESKVVQALRGRLQDGRDNIHAAVQVIDSALTRIDEKSRVLGKGPLCNSRRECAIQIAQLLDSTSGEVRSISENLQAVRRSVDAIQADLAVAGEVFRQTGDDLAFATGQANRAFLAMQRLVDVTAQIISDGNYDVITTVYLDARVLAVFDKNARAVIRATIRAMRPLERAIDSADNKTYGLVSLGREFFQKDLQSEIDDAASKLMKDFMDDAENQKSTAQDFLVQAHLSLARASCENLLGATSDAADSYLTPFLLKAVINSFDIADLRKVQGFVKRANVDPTGDGLSPATCGNDGDLAASRFIESFVDLGKQAGDIKSSQLTDRTIILSATSVTRQSLNADLAKAITEAKAQSGVSPIPQSTGVSILPATSYDSRLDRSLKIGLHPN